MSRDVFDRIATELGRLPEEVQEAYERATIQEVDKAAEKLNSYFIANSGSRTLNEHRVVKRIRIQDSKVNFYIVTVDWDDNKSVNELKGKKRNTATIARNAKITRRRGKRNYSIRPATTHDLAYIINSGQKNADGTVKRLGTYFITKGLRRIKNLNSNIEKQFEQELILLGKRFE